MKLNRNIIQLSLVSVGIFLILGTYFLYPKIKEKKFIQNETVVKEQDVEKKTKDSVFENVEYKGIYNVNNSFTVKSKKAKISDEDPNLVYLTSMNVTFHMQDGKVINITSEKGKYNKVTYDCFFEDNVRATDSQTIIKADNLDLLSSEDYANVYNNVFLTSDNGSLKADRIHYNFIKKLYQVTMFDEKTVKKKFRIIKFKSKPILSVKNISKSFDSRVILRKIDIHLNKGEMLGLLGSNGAGKSTFMNIVLGLLKCDFGDIFLGNTKLTNLAIHQRSKLGIAYLPQQTSIFRGLTVYENLLAIAQIAIKKNAEQKEIVEKLMAEFSITHLRDVKATALSGGERRRTEIARCLINNPKVLLLDEPFAGVDLLSIQDIKGLLLKLQARGCAVLVTDHNASQLLSVVDRAYVIANGIIVANGTPRQIASNNEAKKLYFGENFTY